MPEDQSGPPTPIGEPERLPCGCVSQKMSNGAEMLDGCFMHAWEQYAVALETSAHFARQIAGHVTRMTMAAVAAGQRAEAEKAVAESNLRLFKGKR